jgi:hypothetical protein
MVKTFWTILITVLAGAGTLMASQLTDTRTASQRVTVDSVTLKDLSSDRIVFELQTHVASTRNLRIKEVRFEQMHLGNVPVYLRPLDQDLILQKDISAVLPPIPLTIYFRDLDSLESLKKIVRDQQAEVEGNARLRLDLKLLERIVGGPDVTHADIPIKVTVPVFVPGGFLGQTAALATLSAAQVALDLGGSSLNMLRQSEKDWEEDCRTRYLPALVTAEARYSLRLQNGERLDFVVRGIGFRISPDQFVLTSEMIEPWKYDTDVAASLKTGATLLEDGRDLIVWRSGQETKPSTGRSLAQGAIQVVRTPVKAESTRVAVGDKIVKLEVYRRDSKTNYAVLRFTRPEDKGTGIPEIHAETAPAQSWDRLLLFRANDNGQLELLPSPAHRQDGRIYLDDPVDERAFGSLLIAPQAPVGMLQDENSGISLPISW